MFEVAIFKSVVKNRIEIEHFVAFEQLERRDKFLRYWCNKDMIATLTDAFEH